jgi:hypothetical protein
MAVGYQVRLALINRIISNRATIAFVDVSIKPYLLTGVGDE